MFTSLQVKKNKLILIIWKILRLLWYFVTLKKVFYQSKSLICDDANKSYNLFVWKISCVLFQSVWVHIYYVCLFCAIKWEPFGRDWLFNNVLLHWWQLWHRICELIILSLVYSVVGFLELPFKKNKKIMWSYNQWKFHLHM